MIVTVTGHDRVCEAPGVATVHLSLSFESSDRGEAMTALRRAVQQLAGELDALKAMVPSPVTSVVIGVPGTRTWHPWNDRGEQQPAQHSAEVRASARFTDFDALGEWAPRWGERSGWDLGGVDWELTDERRVALEEQVLGNAVADARRRAQVLATAAGLGPVSVLELSDPGLLSGEAVRPEGGMPVAAFAMARAQSAADGIAIVPDEVEVSACIHARFEA